MSTPPPPPPPLQRTVYFGTFIQCASRTTLKIQELTLVGVDEKGVIRFIERNVDYKDVDRIVKGTYGWGEYVIVRPRGRLENSFWFPGFVDTHTHAPQTPNTSLTGNTTLLSWLTRYTFPLESSLASTPLAHKIYTRTIALTLAHGTTTCAYYATTHLPATNTLSTLCLRLGQRAYIGRCNMDRPVINPPWYRDASAAAALADTLATIAHIHAIDPPAPPTHPPTNLITPILTPRFAPSCTPSLLRSLAALATSADLPIQTHLAENPGELALVRDLFPDQASYAHVYDAHGLLTPKTLLAHAIHLSAAERALLAARGCKVAHCPVSNTALGSGCCRVRELLDAGIDVGLGTDMSGGYSPSILVAARAAAGVARTLVGLGLQGEGAGLGVEECLYLATVGGAKCLGLEGRVGVFDVGCEWDAQLVELGEVVGEAGVKEGEGAGNVGGWGPVDLWGTEGWEEKVAKWFYCGDERNTRKVWVRGRLVHERV
ncbi:hypothetical protein MMC08_003241 [Hypocenomyce scalaris]|nr:hypothetical protein [Hypocenomyce scalaris]